MKGIFAITLSSIFLLSCDPGRINNYVVENKSDYLIETEFRLIDGFQLLNSTDTIQRILIKPNSKIKVVDYGEIGNAYDKEEEFLEAFDVFNFRINGMEISKKIVDRKNWKYEVVNEGLLSMDEVEYKLVIENKDLKKK